MSLGLHGKLLINVSPIVQNVIVVRHFFVSTDGKSGSGSIRGELNSCRDSGHVNIDHHAFSQIFH